ncbi:hypothetical protein H6G89_29275 [Oscillatoria sp. FACHB-1407]|uniref:hypothetical protein n=1 Tax=Oscillatoria sp. FACHB-1407 TaxID=2692847 RepID=UPI00168239E1|nr:hypothetical protein [Oscillatoria sp. FACHB-1407]MBD2465102.1 hypothetical protein [Oscillatoria sp. FACHB-1407]
MTPTLLGRWQSRLLLLATVGVLISIPFAVTYGGPGSHPIFFWVLGYVAGFGLVWDVLYDYLQKFRWDRDWPAAFQLLAGIWEGVFIGFLFKTLGLPGMTRDMPLNTFILHYSLVWLGIFIISQTLMRVLLPRWRFRGGQVL